ncbi:ATP-binding cassette domain-containing protein [Aequorivita lipolytica]|uniref:ATP-binding cassette domain-containing protein n=1 Tax=Aequorivita lipolytica TaxID=153267 RepID=A0A5C6YMP9_9FLAO|nr:ATP-binding cassette domain-containing protein [Aequorivita lipolytica]TXD68553.1 ATP-binding cassette domain-containing protein [Aequorivita lipolytica]SRX53297.1 Lipopolysaccharide export system ATP-binding protein LptB [Aequorivita lipolytica]
MAILQLHSAAKSFGNKVVIEKVSFTLNTGEILGVFGRNGCGKSTLLKMLFGTEKSNFIRVSINEERFDPKQNIKNQQIAYLPQHPFLPKNIKVRDVIPIYFEEEKKQDAIFYDSMISQIAAKKVGELSMGQLRYLEVLLIGNLSHPFIMLDEPFSMIEPLYKIEIKKFLNKLKNDKGIITTDHYYEDVLAITTKNLLLKDGESYVVQSRDDLRSLEYLKS